jgi:NAD(P)H-dependent FMN reductase
VTTQVLRVVGIAASARPGSTSTAALEVVLDRARELGCGVDRIRLADEELPFCDGDKTAPWPSYPGVARLRAAVAGAHAVVLSTPEYHGGMSGAMKNALDLLDFPHAEGKVFGAISALGGRSNANALNQLRTSVRWLRGWMVPDQVAVPDARHAHTNGRFHDPAVVQRLEELADALVRAAHALVPGAPAAYDSPRLVG